MPKMKTKKGALKRFRRTKLGRLKRARSNRRHILIKKTQKRKRHLRKSVAVHDSERDAVLRMLRKK